MLRTRNSYLGILTAAFVLLGTTLSATAVEPADPFNTSDAGLTSVEFGSVDIPPIPADFFGPGSDPFTGIIPFAGTGDPNAPDTAIQRSGPIVCPGTGFPRACDPVAIEIVELSLVSIAPITVTFNGGQTPEEWDVALGLSTTPQTAGTLNASLEKPEGGLFQALLRVTPRLQLVKVSDPVQTTEYDFGTEGINPLELTLSGAPWVISTERWDILTPSNTNFVPLIDNGDNTVPALLDTVSGSVRHWIEPYPNPNVPAVSQWGLVVLTLLVLSAGTVVVARRRKVMA